MRLDFRYGLRGLMRNPGFFIPAVLTVALAIGVFSAIFSVADAVLFRALPYPDSGRLVMVWDQLQKFGQDHFALREETFSAYSAQEAVFERTAAFRLQDGNLNGIGEPEHLLVLSASPQLFEITGAAPVLGRAFSGGDRAVAILSHGLFLRQFGGRADAIGRSIRLDDRSVTVIGVLPAGFAFSEISQTPDLWIPLERRPDGHWGAVSMLARLRPGVSIRAAQSALDAVAAHLEETLHLYRGPKDEDAGYRVKVISLRDQMLGEFRSATWILLSAVAAVLLIALVNVAHLLLIRAASREKEFAIRRAVGATQSRLLRQWMVEGALLSAIGGSLGAMI
jgi:putative ABC transport system permease protein